METIRISVRNLVEFILRSGDIDNRKGGIADKEAMQLGSRLHRKIQGQMGADYRAEVPLKYMETFPLSGKENMPEDSETGSYELSVEGRADGIFTEDGQEIIDEIKGIPRWQQVSIRSSFEVTVSMASMIKSGFWENKNSRFSGV